MFPVHWTFFTRNGKHHSNYPTPSRSFNSSKRTNAVSCFKLVCNIRITYRGKFCKVKEHLGNDSYFLFLTLTHLLLIAADIKPDNIGFDIRGDVKVFDFGVS